MIGLYPARSLFNDLLNHVVLDHFANVDLVVSLLEDAILTSVLHFHIVEQLQPQVLQLVSVVLEEIEVVTNCRKNLIKFRLKVTTIVLRGQLSDGLRRSFACLRVGSIGGISLCSLSLLRLSRWYLVHKTVLFRVFV